MYTKYYCEIYGGFKVYCIHLLQIILTKFILYFSKVSMNFESWNEFLEI
jgi:hypothetical protein